MGGNCGNMAVRDCVGCGVYHTSPDSLDGKGICVCMQIVMKGEELMNIWDIVIGLLLVGIVAGAVYGCMRRKKKGCCSGGSCCSCHKKEFR